MTSGTSPPATLAAPSRPEQTRARYPDAIAAAIAGEIGRDVDYRPVATDGAARAAARLAEML